MQISIIKEENENEQRVASTPDVIKLLARFGAEILIEKNAGDLSGYSDKLYAASGANIVTRSECLNSDICLCVRMPSQNDINQIFTENGMTFESKVFEGHDHDPNDFGKRFTPSLNYLTKK